MAKAAFSLVLPIIFIVMFCLVDENMGCGQYIGPCPVRGTCDQACKAQFGPKADGICDFTVSASKLYFVFSVFNLEKIFKITYLLLVLHMWIVLLRLKEEGEEDVDLGQSVYEIYNHNVEVRVFKTGVRARIVQVNLLLLTWMKEFERIFYGNVYDPALLPDAKPNDLQIKLWRQQKDMSVEKSIKESIFSGNFFFNPLENKASMT
ncbi:hypothetical protein F2Q69_00019884 [Brassica cretica]|uniref:Ubiquinol-cytochrome c chaperone domain-containing protein n=1 Tax=Brassica cretica TaxID=69181 RepID=A0A8S9QDF9_BRACR|nr:hypothetical protein F2Q69_00019884 [Brassica cretica]